VDPGEQCDEGEANGTSGSCCTSECTFVDDGTSCEDGNSCTQDDVCLDGVCNGTNFCPTDKTQCKSNGWQSLISATGQPFKNQGDCLRYVKMGK